MISTIASILFALAPIKDSTFVKVHVNNNQRIETIGNRNVTFGIKEEVEELLINKGYTPVDSGVAFDVQVGLPRFWTGVGLVMFVIASFALYRPIDGSNMRMSWITLVSGIAMMALAFIVGMPSMVRTRFATPTIGREWLIGTEGVAVSDVNPEGIVNVHNAQWRARTNRSTPITSGTSFRVSAIDGITLEIEPLEGAARDYREKRSGASE